MSNNNSSWWKLGIGFLFGALAPSLIAWGSMSTKISRNEKDIDMRLRIVTFNEYKKGNSSVLAGIQRSLDRIEEKIDRTK